MNWIPQIGHEEFSAVIRYSALEVFIGNELGVSCYPMFALPKVGGGITLDC